MIEGENRQIPRDSLLLMADLRMEGLSGEFRVRVRNLSAGGMMGEGAVSVVVGSIVEVDLRNVGWVKGSVAWVQGSRFGLAFTQEIDARAVMASQSSHSETVPGHVRGQLARMAPPTDLRKV